jgi:hypothetical protein
VIALQRIEPEPQALPRRRAQTAERSRAATRRRFARAQRRGYLGFLRVAAVVAVFVLPLMLYVTLTANLTSLNYALTRADAQKTELLAQTMRQDDRIAKLESRERLAALAARLNMHDPRTYAVVTLPVERRAPAPGRGIALLGAVGQWLDLAVGGSGR